MLWTVVSAVGGLALLYFGGEWLVRGAASLAARLGMAPLAIGLTVVAFGTSAPELVVSLDAALGGANDISVGNVVGSNIANIALILGMAVMIRPVMVHAQVVRIDAPLVVVVSLLLVAAMAGDGLSRPEALALLVGLVAYVGWTLYSARKAGTDAPDASLPIPQAGVPSVWPSTLTAFAGLAMLVAGGHLLVEAAVALATSWGVSQAVIGLTIVAIGTSLPEFATSVIAAVRGQGDIAVGNIVGSNLFNILGILGVTALVQPLQLGGITWVDLATMVGLGVVLAVAVALRPLLTRWQGGGLLAVYAAYTGWLVVA